MSRPPCSFKSRMKHMLTPGPFTPLTPFAYFPPHVLMTGRKADVAEKKSKKESNGEMLIVKCTLLNSFLILAFFPVSPCRNFPGSSLRDNWGTKVISLLSNLLSLHSARHWKVVFYLVLWRHGHEAVRVSLHELRDWNELWKWTLSKSVQELRDGWSGTSLWASYPFTSMPSSDS